MEGCSHGRGAVQDGTLYAKLKMFGVEKIPVAFIICTMPSSSPTFERPPLTEMVMGVQFEPLLQFRAAHVGFFWSRIRTAYPHPEDQMAVGPAKEEAEFKPAGSTTAQFVLAAPPLLRWLFVTEDKTELIQLQRDRFWRNWRQVKGNESYPRFDRLARDFKQAWGEFLAFASEQSLGPVNVNQCELVYINHIERGAGWTELGELEDVFPFLCRREPKGFLPPPEVLSWSAKYKLPEGRGRLHVDMNPILRGQDLKLALALSLIARGVPASSSQVDISAWFDLAHEWITQAFAELTGSRVHQLWGVKS